jgi:hypothetical protein
MVEIFFRRAAFLSFSVARAHIGDEVRRPILPPGFNWGWQTADPTTLDPLIL